ncbi:MAG: hypothetical protein ACR2H6_13080 [Pyrinomonadaceae bacterium]
MADAHDSRPTQRTEVVVAREKDVVEVVDRGINRAMDVLDERQKLS